MVGALIRAMKGVCTLDELLELLSAMGADVDIQASDHSRALEALGAAVDGGAVPYLLDGTMKDGQRILAILVLPQSGTT